MTSRSVFAAKGGILAASGLSLLLAATGCGVAVGAASVGVASAGAATVSPAKPTSAQQPVLHSAAEMPAELKKAVADFPEPLPDGAHWFRTVPEQFAQPQTGYEEGVVDGVVASYWLCAWEKSYMNAFDKSDAAAETSSLAEIAKWESLPYYKADVVDPDHGWRKTVLDPARQGEPSALQAQYATSCRLYEANNPG